MKRIPRVFGDIDALRFVDDRLDATRRAAFVGHLTEDPETADRVLLWSRQNEAIRTAFASIASEPVPVWLRLGHLSFERDGMIEPRAAEPPAPRHEATVARLAPVAAGKRQGGPAKAIAVALALVVLGAVSIAVSRNALPLPRWPGEERQSISARPMDALVSRAVDAFRTFALDPVHPVEIASTQLPQLEHWLQRRLALPVHAPDLRQYGWSLLGGRLAPGDMAPGAFFVYENGSSERMGLYIARIGAAPESPPVVAATPGGSTLTWVSGPVGFVLAASESEAWMGRNADSLSAKAQAAVRAE